MFCLGCGGGRDARPIPSAEIKRESAAPIVLMTGLIVGAVLIVIGAAAAFILLR